MHPMTVLRWERRDRRPGSATTKALSSLLQVNLDEVSRFFFRGVSPVRKTGLPGTGLRSLRERNGVSA
ncbi:conserved hypothetical protein [Aeromicrobium sp. 9AM]|nr:conserved hypothetical protein [Aeromicrobium sp. 9AM]